MAKDISAAVARPQLEVSVIGCKPAVDDLQHFEALSAEEEGPGFHVAMQIDAAFHLQIHCDRLSCPGPDQLHGELLVHLCAGGLHDCRILLQVVPDQCLELLGRGR
jgi:hypothetical protein